MREELERTEHAQYSITVRQRTGTPTAVFKGIYLLVWTRTKEYEQQLCPEKDIGGVLIKNV